LWPYSWNFFPNAPKFEETPLVAIKQGGAAEAAITGVVEMMINRNLFLAAHWSPWGEMVKKKCYDNKTFVDLAKKYMRHLKHIFIS
jgi:hypothetical protein